MVSQKAKVHHITRLYPSELPEAFDGKIAGPPAVRWTRYGHWNDLATKVFNERGDVIYEVRK